MADVADRAAGVVGQEGLASEDPAASAEGVRFRDVLRPLPARSEPFGYGLTLAYLDMHGELVTIKFEVWRELAAGIRAPRLDSYDIADRLRLRPTGKWIT
ncbi:hypothetical protein [Streptomyces sp. NPDC054794]